MSSLDYDPAYRQITDTMQGYADNDAKDRFMASQTAKLLSDKGQDPDIAWEIDAVAEPPGPPITDESILAGKPWDGKSKPNEPQVMAAAGRTLYEYFKKTGQFTPEPRDYDAENREASATLGRVQAAANPDLAEQQRKVAEFQDAEAGEPAKRPELTDTDFKNFALDSSGWMNLGFTNLGLNYLKLNDAPEDVRHAIGAIYHITNSPNWYRDNPMGMNIPGAFRLGEQIITDPISFFSLGQLRGVLGAGAKIAQKAGIKNPWMQKLSAGLFGKAIMSGEGGSLAAMQEIMVQKMQGRKEIDFERVRLAGLYGFAFTAGLTTAAPLAVKGGQKLMGAADRMAADGATMRMFLGEGSLTADQKALGEAKRMTKAGETPEAIEAKTGWALDEGDGKWRYEISDDKATFKIRDADLNVLKARGIEVQTDLRDVDTPEVDKLVGQENYAQGRIFNYDPEVLNLDELRAKNMSPEVVAAAERVDAAMRAQPRKGTTLGDVLNHEELFAAYPWLRDQRVDIDTQLEGGMVRVGDAGDEVTLGIIPKGSDTTLRKVGLHEIQHMIQKEEGMAPGGSPEMFMKSPEEIEAMKTALQTMHAAQNWLSFSAANQGMPLGKRWSQWKEEYAAANGFEPKNELRGLKPADGAALKQAQDQIHNVLQQSRSPGNSYLLLAGEVEARNVEARADMTPMERRLTPARDTEIETLPHSPDEKLPAHVLDIKKRALLKDKIYSNPDGTPPGTIPFQRGGQAASPDVRMSKPGKTPSVPHAVQTETDNPSSIVNMVYNAAGDPPPPPSGSKWTKAQLAQMLDQQAEEAGRKITVFDDAALDQISDTITNETAAALGRKGNASGWYNADIKKTINTINKVHPEIKQGNVNEGVFMLGMAITSNGKTVDYNFKAAEHLYQHFKNTGRFPDDAKSLEAAVGGFGQEVGTLVGSMQKANRLIDKMGVDDFVGFLNTPFTVRELKAAGFTVSSEGQDYMTHGSVIFGPKIGGGFYQNLRGNFDPITFDRWWSYSWGRWTGNAVKKYSEKGLAGQLDTFRARLTEDMQASGSKKGIPKTERGLMTVAREMYKTYKKNNFQPRTDLNKAAQRFVEGRTTQMELEPGGSGQRNYMRKSALAAIEKLKKLGYNVTPADLQATVWYPEKELHRHFKIGTSRSDPDSYSLAAERFLKEYRKGAKGGRGK